MKVVVFGGSGFLGSHVSDALVEAGHNTVIFDRADFGGLKAGQALVTGDILDTEAVENVVRDADFVYNFAGIADLDDAATRAAETVSQNILGNVNVLNACVKTKVKRFIYASTLYVYSPLGGFYRCSKQASEVYIEEYHRKYGLSYTVLRFGTLYGPRATPANSIYRYLMQALTEGKISCDGTGEEIREYIHVRDAASLSVDVLADKFADKHVIITGHHPMKFDHMLQMIKEILNGKVEIEHSLTESRDHYSLTPYSFMPKIGQKLVSHFYVDMGQGLLECLHEMHDRLAAEGLLPEEGVLK